MVASFIMTELQRQNPHCRRIIANLGSGSEKNKYKARSVNFDQLMTYCV